MPRSYKEIGPDFQDRYPNSIETVASVECLDDFHNEYVYDIVMEDESTPYFFGNDILVHNSVYFKTGADNEEDATEISDVVSDGINASFPKFMRDNFLVTDGFDTLIQCGREVVGRRGIFTAKKRYTIHVVNMDGYKCDKIKAMGSEIKKSDTPKFIQGFLKTLIMMILKDDADYAEVEKYVNEFRLEFRQTTDLLKIGSSKSCNNLDKFQKDFDSFEKEDDIDEDEDILYLADKKIKVRLPGHVRAAINHNESIKRNKDTSTMPIISGQKIRVFSLLPNQYGYSSIAISGDVDKFPPWFEEFKIDIKEMEEKLITKKVNNIFKAINWEVPSPNSALANSLLIF